MMHRDPNTGLWLLEPPRLCSLFPAFHGIASGAGEGFLSGNGINFDGTNDYLLRGAGLTGASDGKQGTVSVWLKTAAAGATEIIGATGNALRVYMTGTERFEITAENSVGLNILQIQTTVRVDDDTWHHLIATWDLSTVGKRHMYLDDVFNLAEANFVDDTIDYTVADWSIGARVGGAGKWNGCLADLWFSASFFDISVEANRRKFITAAGGPVDLGPDGTGSGLAQPLIFQAGGASIWKTNKGTGGGFTENGVLTNCATSP